MVTDEVVPTEREQVQHWREHVLIEAGYPPDDAIALAHNPSVDLHEAVAMLTNGCPTKTALEILT